MRSKDPEIGEALEPKPTEVVRHLSRGIWAAEKGFDLRAEVTIAEAARQMREGAERLKQRHRAGRQNATLNTRWPTSSRSK